METLDSFESVLFYASDSQKIFSPSGRVSRRLPVGYRKELIVDTHRYYVISTGKIQVFDSLTGSEIFSSEGFKAFDFFPKGKISCTRTNGIRGQARVYSEVSSILIEKILTLDEKGVLTVTEFPLESQSPTSRQVYRQKLRNILKHTAYAGSGVKERIASVSFFDSTRVIVTVKIGGEDTTEKRYCVAVNISPGKVLF